MVDDDVDDLAGRDHHDDDTGSRKRHHEVLYIEIGFDFLLVVFLIKKTVDTIFIDIEDRDTVTFTGDVVGQALAHDAHTVDAYFIHTSSCL